MTEENQTKDRHVTLRIEKSLLNSIYLASKQSNLKTSEFIHGILEKSIEKNLICLTY